MTAPPTTSSRGTRVLGVLTLAGLALLLGYALVWSPADVAQADSVRLMYVHVPTAILAFVACFITTVASAMWLKRRSEGWWVLGGAAAEVGLVFTGICLLTAQVLSGCYSRRIIDPSQLSRLDGYESSAWRLEAGG